ncbi:MAG: DNA-processing protein DprA [Firmicutes bacterium]|nr:DNA-processing protein DprA [Bacillota bacterium]
MRQTERGLLLLCCPLGDPMAGALSLAQARELSRRARAAGIGEEDPLRDVTVKDVRRLGYSEYEAGHIVLLLGRERQLDGYLLAAEKAGVTVITRLDSRFPRRLREQLGARCPAALFCRGDLRLLQRPCISVVGSRHLASPGAQFAAQAGRLAAKEGFTLCSGDAMGADRTAQEACLRGGGSVLIFPATELVYCPIRKNTLYAAEGGFELGFSAQRALGRNRFIHAMGEKTLVAQTGFGKGGTWSGSLDNLQHEYSPLFVFDDGSEGARALCARGATPVQALTSLQALTPAQLSFDMQ